jgi:membrane AbrB-like protein
MSGGNGSRWQRRFMLVTMTLAIAAGGGAVLGLAGFPAGWLIGAMIAVAAATMLRVPTRLPDATMQASSLIVGLSIGSAVSPDTLHQLPGWLGSLVLLIGSLVTTVFVCAAYLQHFYGWDTATARLSAMPGALPSVLLMAVEAKVPVARVAVSQIVRQFVLVLSMPLVLMLVPAGSDAMMPPAPRIVDAIDFGALFVAGGAAGALLRLTRLPGAMLIGPMLASALLHLSGVVSTQPPAALMIVVFVVTGALIGTRFGAITPAEVLRTLRPALETIILAMFISAAFAFVASLLASVPFQEVWLSFAPGGVDAMIAISVALNLDSIFVSVHHLFRLLALNLFSPLWLPGCGSTAPGSDTPANQGAQR